MHTQPLLEQARQARRAGALSAAEACYREYLRHRSGDDEVLQELAGVLFGMQRIGEAEATIEQALALRPGAADLLFNRAMIRRALDRNEQALADLDAVLVEVPWQAEARLHRGVLRSDLGRLQDALEDFAHLQREQPQRLEGHFNAGLALTRLDRHEEAIANLERARALAPRSVPVLRGLGNALREGGRAQQGLAVLRECVALGPDDAASHGDLGMCQLAAGQPDEAVRSFRRALALDPRDQTALAGLYLASNEAGALEQARALLDPALIGHGHLSPQDPEGLRAAVLAHPQLRWEPTGKTTRKGEQTAFLDLSPGSPFADHGAQVAQAVSRRIQALVDDPALSTHPWMKGRLSRWRLRMWATVLKEGGHQAPHIHPSGWMSGVFYLDDGDADPEAGQGGTIVFGRGPDELALAAPPLEFRHQPATGELLLFPSYFHHHTLPFAGRGVRISLAFDVVPRG